LHGYRPEMREAMAKWKSFVEELLSGLLDA
jgi:hypothetical protein